MRSLLLTWPYVTDGLSEFGFCLQTQLLFKLSETFPPHSLLMFWNSMLCWNHHRRAKRNKLKNCFASAGQPVNSMSTQPYGRTQFTTFHHRHTHTNSKIWGTTKIFSHAETGISDSFLRSLIVCQNLTGCYPTRSFSTQASPQSQGLFQE